MRYVARWFGLTAAILVIPALVLADEAHKKKPLTTDEMVKIALSAAPPHISKNASVMVPGEEGKMVEAQKGTNGFTCMPWVDTPDTPDPICMDPAVAQWANSLMSKDPKPANTVPGVGYMGRGGTHWEKDGKVVMAREAGSKAVKEPPHWMLMWPLDSKTTGLPTVPNPSGVWIMWDGSPFAHLMIEQDPAKMNP